MTGWEQAWEIHKDTAAEEAHKAWMAAKLSHGFADHPWRGVRGDGGPGECLYPKRCGISRFKHHTDMIPFADLSDQIKQYDYDSALPGFKAGFEVGYQAGLEARDDAKSSR